VCSDEQHRQNIAALKRIETLLETLIKGRPAIDRNENISNTQGFVLDYKDRKRLYIFSSIAIVLDLKALGTYAVAANTWTPINFEEGFKLFTVGTTNLVAVVVRATDDMVA
jgi:hypothetical protein